ncbi:hypothetical protein [Streptomyces sp. NPDC055506]
MADLKCELLQADRESALMERRRLMGRFGARELFEQFDALYADWRRSPYFKPGSDVSVGYVDAVADELKAAMADLGASRERLDSFRIVTTLSEAVSAQMTPFTDGSGLVIIADGIVGLCCSYSEYVALSVHRWTDWHLLRASRKSRMYQDAKVLTGLLRYNTTHQRLLGTSTYIGMRLGPRGQEAAWQLTNHAYRFVIGHEIAHHVLGHTSGLSSFGPGEHVPVCSESERRERDADLFAFQAVRRAGEMPHDGSFRAQRAVDLSTIGALIAMLALHLSEQALFVRRGCTHPPASIRAAWLLSELDSSKRKFMERLFRIPREATEAAAQVSENAHTFSWEALKATPARSFLPQEYLELIGQLDEIQCWPEGALVELLADPRNDFGNWLGEGARIALAGQPAEALRHWGVSESNSQRLCDPQRALTFFTLQERLERSFVERGIAREAVLLYAMAATTLIAARLKV